MKLLLSNPFPLSLNKIQIAAVLTKMHMVSVYNLCRNNMMQHVTNPFFNGE
jgi:hypothetical protein